MIDVRDLAAWLLDCAEAGTTGTYNSVGPAVSLGKWITLSREIGGHTGPVAAADDDWLLEQKVVQAMGPESLALWVADGDFAGFGALSGAAATAAGLRHRTRAERLEDTLRWNANRA